MKTFSLSIIALALVGCASTNVTKLGTNTHPPKAAGCEIQVFSLPPKNVEFEEIALISGRSGGNTFSSDDVATIMTDLKSKACEVGADAIIVKDAKEGGWNWAGPKTRAEASAIAIKILAEVKSAPKTTKKK